MMTNKEFVNGIWEKCNKANNEKFYKKHQYKFIETVRIIKTTIISVLSVMVLSGAVYAGYVGVNKYLEGKLLEEKTTSNKDINVYRYFEQMDYNKDENIYYKVIKSKDEYNEIKEYWNDFIEVEENEFEDSFIVVIKPVFQDFTLKETEFRLSDINVLDNELKIYIDIKNQYTYDELNKIDENGKVTDLKVKDSLVLKLSKDIYKDKITIINKASHVNVKDNKSIEDIHIDYTKEQAIVDGCFVIEESNPKEHFYDIAVLNKEKSLLNDFVQGENSYIRICIFGNNDWLKVYDIEKKNEEFLINEKNINNMEKTENCYYYIFDKVKVKQFEKKEDVIEDIIFYSSNRFPYDCDEITGLEIYYKK